ncbi:MAG: cytochrome d ubiquinol oxidase subunit II [Melioribacteraceae bacterium]|nr:cytochrome d ubiquinol oxidase subunit II [Melioribacteraceae bacterium]
MDLNIIWFILIAVLIIGYAILDGFDFGVGILHLFAKNENEKRIGINAIAPVWDGNEVWLLTAGGALFAAFPIVYASVFSGFYIAIMLLLVALIFRAVSMEFRGKVESESWRKTWDVAFGIGSTLPPVLFGVAIGNIIRGIPLNANHDFTGTFLSLLNPYAVLVGVLSLVLFTMHGAIYLTMKTEEEHKTRMINIIPTLWIAFVTIYFVVTLYSIFESKFLFDGILSNPIFWITFPVMIATIIFIPVFVKSGKFGRAFLCSSITIAAMVTLMAIGLFPNFVPSLNDNLAQSLTIYNASSSQRTLETMLYIALLGMPLVIGYTSFIYRIFKGKVVLNEDSY